MDELVLETRNSLACRVERQIADRVEEQGAAGSFGDTGRAGSRRTGEQAARDQTARSRPALRAARPRFTATNGPLRRLAAWNRVSEHILTGAGLAKHEHRQLGRRDQAERAPHRNECGAADERTVLDVGTSSTVSVVMRYDLIADPDHRGAVDLDPRAIRRHRRTSRCGYPDP